MEHDRERSLEDPHARSQRFDPILWEETIFLNVAEAGDLHLWALDRKDGSLKWKKFLSGGDHRERKQNMSSPSPLTDGKTVWVMTGTGILKAFDFAGKELWSRDIQKDYGKFGLNWGYASSPLLHEGSLYVQVLHGMKTDDPSYLLRIDAANGKTLWRVERPTDAIRESPDSYTTPALLEYDGKKEIVVTGGDVVTGTRPRNRAKSSGAPTGSTRRTTPTIGSSRRPSSRTASSTRRPG